MTSLGVLIGRGLLSARPAAATPGSLYYATDTSTLYRDSGSTWESVEGAGGLSNPMTTAGDLIVGGASGTPTRLAAGSATNVLTMVSGAPAWAAAGGGGGAPTTAPYVTTASDATLSAEVIIPGLAGSPDIAGATVGGGGTIAREFDAGDTTLPTWTPSAPTEDINSTVKSHLYITWADATERYGYYAWTPGAGAFNAVMKVAIGDDGLGGASGAVGLVVADSGNANRLLVQAAFSSSPSVQALCYTYTGGAFTARGITPSALPQELYLRIARDGSNNCSFYYSTSGKVWSLMAAQAFTLTVAQIGVRLSALSATAHYGAIDFLRATP